MCGERVEEEMGGAGSALKAEPAATGGLGVAAGEDFIGKAGFGKCGAVFRYWIGLISPLS